MKSLPQRYNKIASEMKRHLQDKFGSNIDELIFYGSRVTGKAKRYSDYDFLIILNKPYDWQLKTLILDECTEVDLLFNIVSDIKLLSVNEMGTIKGKLPFIQEALKTGIHL